MKDSVNFAYCLYGYSYQAKKELRMGFLPVQRNVPAFAGQPSTKI